MILNHLACALFSPSVALYNMLGEYVFNGLLSFVFLFHRDKAPGQIECDEAIEVLNRCIRDVDQASLAAVSQQLNPRDDISQEVSVVV